MEDAGFGLKEDAGEIVDLQRRVEARRLVGVEPFVRDAEPVEGRAAPCLEAVLAAREPRHADRLPDARPGRLL